MLNPSPNLLAKIAGFGYLVIFVTGIYANFFVLESLVVKEEAALTVQNLLANTESFRLGIFAFIVMVLFDLLLAWAFYLLFIPVSRPLSQLAAWFRVINVALFAIALYHLVKVTRLLEQTGDAVQLQSQVMHSLGAFNDTWVIGLIFFGVHLGILGYLIVRSNFLPTVIGALLMFAALGYLCDSFAQLLLSNYASYADFFVFVVFIPAFVAELSLCLWLLFKGLRPLGSGYDEA